MLTTSINRQGFSQTRKFIDFSSSSRRRPGPITTGLVARMQRSAIRGVPPADGVAPDCAPLHPGYEKSLQNEPAQVSVLGEVADVLLHVIRVDLDGLAVAVRRGERNLVEHALH